MVLIFTTSDCSGDPIGSGNSVDFPYETNFPNGGIVITVPDNSTNDLRLVDYDPQTGNRSGCPPPSIRYVEDSVVTPPTLTSTTPASGADNNLPSINGTAEAGATVAVYATADCSGPSFGEGTASASGDFSVALTTVLPNNSSTIFH